MEYSRAHILLLSKFLKPQIIASKKNIGGQTWADWTLVLGEPVNAALRRLIKDGLLRPVTHSEKLICKYKVSELKEMLRQRRRRVTGRKADLAERLLRSDPDGIKEAFKGLDVLVCTSHRRKIAEYYLMREKEKMGAVEQKVWESLQNREFRNASGLVASFEATQLFPRGMNVNWDNFDHSRNLKLLNYIFQSKPQALEILHLSDAQLDNYRIVAGMYQLFGTWKGPQEFYDLNSAMHKAVHMLRFHAYFQMERTKLKHRGTKLVEVVGYGSQPAGCDACRRLGEMKFVLDSVPELPHVSCENYIGCRCGIVVARIESWEVIKVINSVGREPTAMERSSVESVMTKEIVSPETKALCWAYLEEVMPLMIKALDDEFGRPSWIWLFSTRTGKNMGQRGRRGQISYLYDLIELVFEVDRQALRNAITIDNGS